MIKAKGVIDNRETIFLGLTQENVQRLQAGEPILIHKEEMALPFDVFIFWGKDHATLKRQLAPATDKDTKLRIGTLHGGEPK